MKEFDGYKISLSFSFPNDKISKEKRAELAQTFAQILGVSVLVCDKDCNIAVIKHSNCTVEEDNHGQR